MNTEKDFSGFYHENKTLLKEYLETRFTILKLQGIRTISRTMSMVIIIFVVSLLALFTILFLGFSFAWWLSAKTGSNIVGFAGAAGLFFILMILAILLRKPLFQTPLIRMFIRESARELHETP